MRIIISSNKTRNSLSSTTNCIGIVSGIAPSYFHGSLKYHTNNINNYSNNNHNNNVFIQQNDPNGNDDVVDMDMEDNLNAMDQDNGNNIMSSTALTGSAAVHSNNIRNKNNNNFIRITENPACC